MRLLGVRPAGRRYPTGFLGVLMAIAICLVWPASALATHAPPGTKVWGYEAFFGSPRILQYDIGTDTFDMSCVPDTGPSTNGRGIAYDPVDGNLWYSRLNFFTGDGLIHKATLPPACSPVTTIPFGDGPGGTVQDDIGAMDVDPDDSNLWVAGYGPPGGNQVLYKVNRSSGAIIQKCTVPPTLRGGNDTITEAKLTGLPGSGSYLLTDAGEFIVPTLMAVDEATCTGGGAGTIAATFSPPFGMTGNDYELGRLIAAAQPPTIHNLGSPPFATTTAVMSQAPSSTVEDITLKAQPVASTPGKVTGGGYIDPVTGQLTGLATLLIKSSSSSASVNKKATFGFVAQFKSGDPAPTGNLEYYDHAANEKIKATSYSLLAIRPSTASECPSGGQHATIKGMALQNGTPGHQLRVEVDDCGEPGSGSTAPDRFEIHIDDPTGYTASGVLIGGNIQIHKS